jgi:hypothetical protein
MDDYPLVRYADGLAGSRARLIGGPDVWEVVSIVHDNDGDLEETAAYLELPLGLIQVAFSYYGTYPQEINEQIKRNHRAANEAHTAFLAGRRAVL